MQRTDPQEPELPVRIPQYDNSGLRALLADVRLLDRPTEVDHAAGGEAEAVIDVNEPE